jgi:rubrerythrin
MCATTIRRKTRAKRKSAASVRGSRSRIRERITSRAELYAHAIAIEREAVRSYREFSLRMADLGNDTLADLFGRLESLEQGHLRTLQAKTAAMTLPDLAPGEYAWLDNGAPVPEARELVFRMMTPRVALDVALVAEQRAKAFFQSVSTASRDRAICALAREFAAEEQIHIDTIQFALDGLPVRFDPAGQQWGEPAVPQQSR